MKQEIQNLYTVWRESELLPSIIKTSLPQVNSDEVITSIFTSGKSYFYVINFFGMSLSHVTPSIEDIHGLKQESVFNDILNLMHPDDIEHVCKTKAKMVEMFKDKIGLKKSKNYKLTIVSDLQLSTIRTNCFFINLFYLLWMKKQG